MRRRLAVLAAAGIVGLAVVPAASAAPRCSVPTASAWHSCLTAGHRAVEGTDNVLLTRVSPVLVIRSSACPADVISRKVTIRTNKGKRLARKRVTGKCKNGVTRYRVNLHPDLELRVNTVIRSFWSRLDDEDKSPGVKLKLET
jgi:hypothetical protein